MDTPLHLFPLFLADIDDWLPIIIPLGILMICVGIPVISWALVSIVKITHQSKSAKLSAEEALTLEELNRGFSRFEERMNSLETIVLERHRQQEEKERPFK